MRRIECTCRRHHHHRGCSMMTFVSLLLMVSAALNECLEGVDGFIAPHRGLGTTTDLTKGKSSSSIPSSLTQQQAVSAVSSESFDATVMNRYACTRFQRFDGSTPGPCSRHDYPSSSSNETVVNLALESLNLARRAPSGFNSQPYKLLLVRDPKTKKKLSTFCAGANAYRVCDSDCTAVFLADREIVRTMGRYGRFLRNTSDRWNHQVFQLRKIQIYISLFSSGFPLPRFLAVPISFGVRCFMEIMMKPVARLFGVVLPSLSTAETWAIKNTMLVVMTYMLACTSRGLATSPMEGFNASGIRQVLKIPRRYSIPLIVSTGTAMETQKKTEGTMTTTTNDNKGSNTEPNSDSNDGIGMSHGKPGTKEATPRYPDEDVIFGDVFGNAVALGTA